MYVANKNGAQTWFPVCVMGDASDISDSPMIGQQNVFPDTTACSFPKEAVVEISTQLGNPQTLASTQLGMYSTSDFDHHNCFACGAVRGVAEY